MQIYPPGLQHTREHRRRTPSLGPGDDTQRSQSPMMTGLEMATSNEGQADVTVDVQKQLASCGLKAERTPFVTSMAA
eukprot:CAMPEP_0119103818 /NCGR_PEP_ID=MMETSP1180-20130426/2191_1 /TAXON_ID=3052 ORGANISM="Chlamydomonas cf sp, Strain CCMP681" /NCGR_SAMPLE_ID=MMETSP1180 /ASSEMBLY_ACC=CAM_ASM_000741 /LENGTH=76 /DNA_ID=CAMNT_0007088419 /DNA_START=288 /DNA_END=518 /DNA_ORIENTATION=+